MQKTKMVFTIGPASANETVLSALIEAGMSASRHNFSHGTHEENLEKIQLVKRLREKYQRHIAIILDTKGPEIRLGTFAAPVTVTPVSAGALEGGGGGMSSLFQTNGGRTICEASSGSNT